MGQDRTQRAVAPKTILLLFCIMLAFIITTYSNHFNNAFHFDDSHVVESNSYIQDNHNIPLFFKDGSTISVLPANQLYRPMVTTSLAIDYWLAHGLTPFLFHLSTFCWYILQCILLYFFFLKIANTALDHRWNTYFSFIAATWYGVHTANAETINYVSARSDSLSTFWLILSFILFTTRPIFRTWGIYFIPFIIACLFKQTAIVFPALLFLYVLFFEKNINDSNQTYTTQCIQSLKRTRASWAIGALMFVLLTRMTPISYTPGGGSIYHYAITQPFVIFHYFMTFFLPTHLSADSDWELLPSIRDIHFILGTLFIVMMLALAYWTSKKSLTRPIAFGILWFFITLLPTSSII